MFPKQTMALPDGGEEKKEKEKRKRLCQRSFSARSRSRSSGCGAHGGRTQPGPGLTVGLRVLLQRPQGLAVPVPLHVQIHDLQRERGRRGSGLPAVGWGEPHRGYRRGGRGGRWRDRAVPYLLPRRQHVLGQLLHLGQVAQHEGRVPRHGAAGSGACPVRVRRRSPPVGSRSRAGAFRGGRGPVGARAPSRPLPRGPPPSASVPPRDGVGPGTTGLAARQKDAGGGGGGERR